MNLFGMFAKAAQDPAVIGHDEFVAAVKSNILPDRRRARTRRVRERQGTGRDKPTAVAV